MFENELLKKDLDEVELSLLDREMDRYRKEVNISYVLLIVLGFFGAHKFYLNKVALGVLYFFTAGLFLIGLLYDLITIPQQVADYNERLERDIIDQLLDLRKRKTASSS